MIVRLVAVGLTLAAISGVAVAVSNDGSRSSPESVDTRTVESIGHRYADYLAAEPLIRDSQLIVRAEFVSAASESVRPKNPLTGVSGYVRHDVLRTYRIVETIRGSEQPAAEIIVVGTRGLDYDDRPQFSWTNEQLPAEKGKIYVLFLTRFSRDVGQLAWGRTGEPGQAEVVGDSLNFQTTARYKGDLVERGIALPPGSAAPFQLTLPQLRQLTRKPGQASSARRSVEAER